jgi:hypothetical protein
MPELWVTKTLWPDFKPAELRCAIADFSNASAASVGQGSVGFNPEQYHLAASFEYSQSPGTMTISALQLRSSLVTLSTENELCPS